MFEGIGKGITVGGVTRWARTFFESGSTGNSVAVDRALQGGLQELNVYGWCVQNGTPTPISPVDIECNNGVLRYGARGSNLYDPSTALFEVGYYYAPTAAGAKTAAPNNYIYHAYIPIEAGETYVFYGRRKTGNSLSQYNRIHWYAADKTYISTNAYTGGTIGKGVAPNNASYARLSCNPLGTTAAITEETVLGYNWTFCKGTEEITPFVPFVGDIYPSGTEETLTVTDENSNVQIVTIPMLLGVGNVYDVARLVEKIKAGKVGIKVLDGSEDWTASSSYPGSCYTTISGSENVPTGIAVLCSHFENSVTLDTYSRGKCTKQNAFNLWYGDNRTTAVADLKAFLAAQYAAGTPVIVVYTLETENHAVLEIVTINFARWLNTVAVNKVNSIARNLFDGYYKKML